VSAEREKGVGVRIKKGEAICRKKVNEHNSARGPRPSLADHDRAFAKMDPRNAERRFIGSNNRIPGAASVWAGATINRLPSLAPPAGMEVAAM